MDLKQIKCKNRVADYGEVLTPDWLVHKMLCMIPDDATRINSRYLENSSGEGAFLLGVLSRKLDKIFNTYTDINDRKFYTVVGVSNIYGLELLADNVGISRKRMLDLVKEYFIHRYKLKTDIQFLKTIEHIINKNIINMDALTYKIPIFKNGKLICDENENIIYSDELGKISEWEIDYKTRHIQRVEYFYKDVVIEQKDKFELQNLLKEVEPTQLSLFEYNQEDDLFDEDNFVRVAKPIRKYEKIIYTSLYNAHVLKGED
ncbi:hypothetical protein EU245_15130 [Lentibacillus lipolyticus]|nr:hypothetical protein EU245_15130 [Lentibacillus lipolyticus]